MNSESDVEGGLTMDGRPLAAEASLSDGRATPRPSRRTVRAARPHGEYLAELDAHRDRPIGPRDAANYLHLPLHWHEPGRHPLFIVAHGTRVGFALIRKIEEEAEIEMAELYIRPKFRRTGLGRAALTEVSHRFPGSWRLPVHVLNEAGPAFWSRCIEEFASGSVETKEVEEPDGRRIQYWFEIAVS